MDLDWMRQHDGAAPRRPTRPVIVDVATQMPYPLTSGLAFRQFNILRAYGEVGDAHLVTFYRAEEELAHLAALRRHCAAVHPVPGGTRYLDATYERLPGWRRRLAYVAGTRALLTRLLRSPQMRDAIASLAPSADLLHVSRLGMVANVEGLLRARPPHLRLVLDLDDDETVVPARRARLLSRRAAALAYWEQARLRRYQAWALSVFDRVLVCSPLDRDRLRHPRVVVVPNGAAAATDAPVAARRHAAVLRNPQRSARHGRRRRHGPRHLPACGPDAGCALADRGQDASLRGQRLARWRHDHLAHREHLLIADDRKRSGRAAWS